MPVDNASPPSEADVDTDERFDVADEAEAADEADLFEAVEAPAQRRPRRSWTVFWSTACCPGWR